MRALKSFRFILLLASVTVGFWIVSRSKVEAQASSVDERIQSLVSQLTLEEKVSMLGGVDEFNTREIPRLGIPSIQMTDGPLGVRNGKQTAFPSGIAVGATFNPALAHEMGTAIADEARLIGKNMLLGPCVNISRNPFGGRNFESYGEDPFLTGQLAADYIKGIQGQNVLASVKHFAANDQEFERMTINVNVDTRALFEIHLPAFKAAIDAGVGTVMSAYNRINGDYATDNDFLQTHVLRKMWGFKGFVVSDWGATHDTMGPARHGLDLEMPSGEFLNDSLVGAVQKGELNEKLIDEKIERLLHAMFKIGLMDSTLVKPAAEPLGPESEAHRNLARRISQESIVLLKNEGNVLPLNNRKVRSIALIGPNADRSRTGGGGSSQVEPLYDVSPLKAFKERVKGSNIRVSSRVGRAFPQEGSPSLKTAVKLARESEVAIIFTGLGSGMESEAQDRETMDLPAGQVELIRAVAAVNPNTVVVLTSGNPLPMGAWISQVKAVVQLWYPGQEGGHAIADVLFGDVNPSGKLPVTFLKKWEDSAAYPNYPGKDGQVNYAEGIFVGYRHFDAQNLEPQFPFGHGLSYTHFDYSNLLLNVVDGNSVAPIVRVEFDLTNSGDRAGAEVAQLYVSEMAPIVPRPPKELKGFSKVMLAPGETRHMSFDLQAPAFSYFDVTSMTWKIQPGSFKISVGSSSRDLRLISSPFVLR